MKVVYLGTKTFHAVLLNLRSARGYTFSANDEGDFLGNYSSVSFSIETYGKKNKLVPPSIKTNHLLNL